MIRFLGSTYNPQIRGGLYSVCALRVTYTQYTSVLFRNLLEEPSHGGINNGSLDLRLG
jgi:hypothetical protein